MSIDDHKLTELIVESQDLQVDALRDTKSTLRDLREIGRSRRKQPIDLDRVRAMNESRRSLLKKGGFGLGGLAASGFLGTSIGTAVVSIVARPVAADTELDIDILQTASSLENLAVATYAAALGLPFIADGNETVRAFAETTMAQHDEHSEAFNAQSEALGGERQTETNSKYQMAVDEALPSLTDPLAVANLAATLETVATQTYVNNIAMFEDNQSLQIMASVMGVEAQHLATLRAVIALLEGGGAELITIPTDVAALPAAAGSIAFPEPFEGVELASPPEEGAVQ